MAALLPRNPNHFPSLQAPPIISQKGRTREVRISFVYRVGLRASLLFLDSRSNFFFPVAVVWEPSSFVWPWAENLAKNWMVMGFLIKVGARLYL